MENFVKEVFVEPNDVWKYFQSRQKELQENSVDILAQCQFDGISLQVCITDCKGFPELTLELDDSVLEKDYALNESSCSTISQNLFSKFDDYCKSPESLGIDEEISEDDEEYDVEREMEILEATKQFLSVLFNIPNEELEDMEMLLLILNNIESMLYDEYGLISER